MSRLLKTLVCLSNWTIKESPVALVHPFQFSKEIMKILRLKVRLFLTFQVFSCHVIFGRNVTGSSFTEGPEYTVCVVEANTSVAGVVICSVILIHFYLIVPSVCEFGSCKDEVDAV